MNYSIIMIIGYAIIAVPTGIISAEYANITNKINFEVIESKNRKIIKKSYSDNFTKR